MALRDQPYIPLYVQDYLTDEKLNSCSPATQGVYIKIICILHKQAEYGSLVLFKQKDKQNSSMCLNFACKFAKLLPFDQQTIFDALTELIDEGVLIVEGDKIYQKRMVKDNAISEARSKAGKIGGGNPILFKQNSKHPFKQNPKQNPENENENENEDEGDIKREGGVGEGKKYSGFINSLFEPAKDIYMNFYKDKIGVFPENFIDDDLKSLLIKITGSMKSAGEQLHAQSVIDNLNGLLKKLPKFWLDKLNVKTISNNYDSIVAEIKSRPGSASQTSWADIIAERNR